MASKRASEEPGATSKRARTHEHEEGEIVAPGDGAGNGEVAETSDVDLRTLLGFEGFGSTKNSHVDDNSTTAARGGRAPRQTRKARQYMNLKKKGPKTKPTQ